MDATAAAKIGQNKEIQTARDCVAKNNFNAYDFWYVIRFAFGLIQFDCSLNEAPFSPQKTSLHLISCN